MVLAIEITTTLGNNVRFLREKLGLSREELAQAIGVKVQAISKLESGKHFTTAETLAALASKFETSVARLLAVTGEGLPGEFEGLEEKDRETVLVLLRHLATRDRSL